MADEKRPGKRRWFTGIRLCVTATLLPWVTFWGGLRGVAAQFADCRDAIADNDDNGDSVLAPSDYQGVIFELTEGKILLDMESSSRTSIHQAFDVRIDEALGGVDLPSSVETPETQEAIEMFCENIYQSFFPIFNVTVTGDECSASLFDFAVDDGEIDMEEFAGVTSVLTGETFDAFQDLGSSVQTVYDDFEGDTNVVEIAFLSSRPVLASLFCRRVVLGSALDSDIVVDIPGTLQSPPTQPPEMAIVACIEDLRLADSNDDGRLSEVEYVSLLNSLSNGGFFLVTFDALSYVLRENYEWLKFGADQVYIGDIDNTTAAADDLRQFDWVCSQTEASIELDASGNAALEGDLLLTDCIIISVNADSDGDGLLTMDEFTSAVEVTRGGGNSSTSLTPSVVEEVFDAVSNRTDTIDVSGAGRYQVPNESALLGFEVLCDAMFSLINDTDSLTNTTAPTFAPSSLNFTTFAPTNKTAPTVAPSSLNFTTFAPTVGNASTVPPSVENATLSPTFFVNSTEAPSTSYVPTTAPSPTIAPTPSQTATPSVTMAPSDNQTASPSEGNTPTVAPTMSPADFRQCTLSMLVSDRNRDNLMQTAEFVIFLNRQSGNAFVGGTFDSLDTLFRTLFDSLRKTEPLPSLAGSKPGSQPTTEQTENLMLICTETERVYTQYSDTIRFQPTGAPTSQPTRSLGQEEDDLTSAQLNQCKLFVFVSDANRDSRLSQEEFVTFVNRLTVNAFLGRSYPDLPLSFQDVFGAASGTTGTISTEGARSGQPASEEQLAALSSFCEQSYSATRIWKETRTDSPTSVPTFSPNVSPPTPPPSLSATEFSVCTTSLAVTDRDRDDFLDQAEYVEFINRLTSSMYRDSSFSAIDARLQANYRALSGPSGFINVAGSRPGSRTEEQETALFRVCSETDKVIENLDQGVSPPASPTSAPSSQPVTSQPTESLTPVELVQCQAFAAVSDADRNKFLNPDEYVNFLNALSETGFVGRTFGGLDAAFREAFISVQSDNGSVNILGSRRGEVAPSEQLASLKSFCILVFEAFEDFNNRTPPTSPPTSPDPSEDPTVQQCTATLNAVDFGSDGYIDQLEYVVYVSETSNRTFSFDVPFSSLPYVLQDNFAWISEGSPLISIAGAENITHSVGKGQLHRLARLCRRTGTVISSVVGGNNETNLFPHCYQSLYVADKDEDSLLNKTEFAFMIKYFQGLDPLPSDFADLDEPFRVLFETNKGTSTNAINVEGSKPNEIPNQGQALLLEYFCGEIAVTVDQARRDFQLLTRCTDALSRANTDNDNFLTQDEYVDFVYDFVGENRGQNTYVDLPPELWMNFETLRIPGAGTINIVGWRGNRLTEAEANNIRVVCVETNSAVSTGFTSTDSPTQAPTQAQALTAPPTVENATSGGPKSATIYNGFILKSEDDLRLVDLRNADIIGLEGAYRLFVNSTIVPLLPVGRLRGRRLEVTGVSLESAKIDQIVDGPCRNLASDPCLEAYASFDLLVSQDADVDAMVAQYTDLTQEAIAEGDLQELYKAVSPNRRFDIVGLTENTQPGTKSPTTPKDGESLAPTTAPASGTGTPLNDFDDDGGGGNTIIYMVIAGVVAVALGCGWFFCFNRRKRRLDAVTPENDEEKQVQQYPSQTDNEENYLSTEFGEEDEFDRKQNIVPPHTPDPLLSRSEHSAHSAEPQFGFSPAGSDHYDATHGRNRRAQSSLETVPDDAPLWSPEPSSPAEGYHGENPWGTMNVEDGIPTVPDSSNSSSSSEESAEEVEFTTDQEKTVVQAETVQSGSSGSSHSEIEVEEVEEADSDSVSNEEKEEPIIEEEEEDVPIQEEEEEEETDPSEASTLNDSYISMSAEQRQAQLRLRQEVEKLVAVVVPDELENVDVMMEQFFGREEELIATLRNMAEQAGKEDSDDESYDEEEPSASQYEEEVSASQYEEESSDSRYEEEISESQYEEEVSASQFEEEEVSASQFEEEEVSASQFEEEEISVSQFEEEEISASQLDEDFLDVDEDYFNSSFKVIPMDLGEAQSIYSRDSDDD